MIGQKEYNSQRPFYRNFITAVFLIALTGCGSGSDNITNEQISLQLQEDTSIQQSINFSDTPIVLTAVSNGNLAVSTLGITYTPNANFNGNDSATVEAGTTRYAFSFSISAVNDSPTLQQTSLKVTAADEISGQLIADDIDGDTVTFALTEAPENGALTLTSDGSFTYLPSELELPNTSFNVTLSDAQSSADFTVALSPSYTTNADKAAYYYRSGLSHLKQASETLVPINDDIATEDAYIALAMGYASAGLSKQLNTIIENNITTQQAKSTLYRRLGVVNAEIGSDEKAVEYFELALQIYAQYLVDNGLENITSSDASFVQGLFSDARALNNPALLQKIIDQLNTYTNVLGGKTKEYSTAFGRLITSYRFQVEDTIDVFLNDRSDENKKTALDAIQRFTLTVRETGYQTVRRGDNEGKKYYRLAPLYNADAIAYFLALGETEKAKDQLAYTFSYYGTADYDSDYSLPAQNYAAITALEYTFPLIDVAFTSELIYDFEDNIALSVATSDSFFLDDIETGVKDAKAAKIVQNGGTAAEAIAEIERLYAGDLRDIQTRLTSNLSNRHLGETLLDFGNPEAAIAAYDRGLAILSSDAYLIENTSTTSYSTGVRGCLKYVLFYQRVGETAKAENAASTCDRIRTAYFGAENQDELDVMRAHVDATSALEMVGNSAATIAVINAMNLRLQDYSRSDIYSRLAQVAVLFSSNSNFTAANESISSTAEKVLNATYKTEEEKTEALIGLLDAIAGINYQDDSSLDRSAAIIQLRNRYNNSNYAAHLLAMNTHIATLSDALAASVKLLAVAEFEEQYEDAIEALASARAYTAVADIITSLSLSGEELVISSAMLAQVQALQNDYPSTNIASVDTDGDGLANFYSVQATAEEINASDVIADSDADGDDVEDGNDVSPLGDGN
jgi:hypothetical protein